MSAAHWLVPPPRALMGMRAAPGVPAPGHTLDPQACCACGTARPVPPAPSKPARVRRVVPQPSPTHEPKFVAKVLDALSPGRADAIDDYRDRVQRVGAHAPPADVVVDAAPAPREEPAPACEVFDLPVARSTAPVTFPMRLRAALDEVPPFGTDFTLRQKLLLAGADLALSRGSLAARFDVHDLVVRAWQFYPESFALAGHPEHPDSNRVLAKLSGPDGLKGLGWMSSPQQNTVALTRRGIAIVEDMLARRVDGKTHKTPRPAARAGGV